MPRAKINGRLHGFKVIRPYRDAYALTPEYKVTAVRVEKM